MQRKEDTHLVLKNEDIEKYVGREHIQQLKEIIQVIAEGRERDGKEAFNQYYVVNKDEPYADKIYQIIMEEESLKELYEDPPEVNEV